MGDRTLVVHPAGTDIMTLNPVGSVVWWALDGRRDTDELAEEVLRRTTVADRAVAAADVDRFVASLLDAGLAVPVDAAG